jgi:hypothetical protein
MSDHSIVALSEAWISIYGSPDAVPRFGVMAETRTPFLKKPHVAPEITESAVTVICETFQLLGWFPSGMMALPAELMIELYALSGT